MQQNIGIAVVWFTLFWFVFALALALAALATRAEFVCVAAGRAPIACMRALLP